jgi:hypothetical protein
MNTADFSELFNSVGGMPSLKSINHLAELSEEELHGSYTPSLTETFEIETNLTPTSNVTVIPGIENGSRDDSEAAGKISLSGDDRSADRCVTLGITVWLHRLTERLLISRELVTSDSSHLYHTLPPSQAVLPNRSIDSLRGQGDHTHSTVFKSVPTVMTPSHHDTTDTITSRMQEAIADAKERGAQHLELDCTLVEAILGILESRKAQLSELKNRFDGIKVGHPTALNSTRAHLCSPADK